MKCTLDGNNARALAKAVQSLSKVGAELFIEANQQGLQLRSINSTHSAVGNIRFNRIFFETFQIQRDVGNFCKISMKAWLSVFRNMKQVEHCELCILSDKSKFQVQLKCKLETVKNALISIVDEENINTGVSQTNATNIICGTHKLFTEISGNFNTVEEEITLETKRNHLVAKNYIEGSRVNDKFMRSQLKLNASEFEKYEIDQDTAVTFTLKEFRAFLLFAEWLCETMELQFEDAGSPLFIKINKLDFIECLLIMSTLSPDDVSFYDECQLSEVMENTNINNNGITAATKPNSTPDTTLKRKKNSQANRRSMRDAKRRIAEETTLSNTVASELFRFNDNEHTTAASPSNSSKSINGGSVQAPRLLANGDNEAQIHADIIQMDIDNNTGSSGPQVIYYNTEDTTIHTAHDNNNEIIPQSPNHQPQLRSIFSRCFEATFKPREPSPSSQVYAPNSDTED